MKLIAAAATVLLAARVGHVDGACSVNADCTCAPSPVNLCQDDEGVVYPRTTCDFNSRCYCDTTAPDANGDLSCRYARNPPADPTSTPTDPPTTGKPTEAPTSKPTNEPTEGPSAAPTGRPTARPTERPTSEPTEEPTGAPTDRPTSQPSGKPTGRPTPKPTGSPTSRPTGSPTSRPTGSPTGRPTGSPTSRPTGSPTERPTGQPSNKPTGQPSVKPTGSPTSRPTGSPTDPPTGRPTPRPTGSPTSRPTGSPTDPPTDPPTGQPSGTPTGQPTPRPTGSPTSRPTGSPTDPPTGQPSNKPTGQPTPGPTGSPTDRPTGQPSGTPTGRPTARPTGSPTRQPSERPTGSPTGRPTDRPTGAPTGQPTAKPTGLPTRQPSERPTDLPTGRPTGSPTSQPTDRRVPTGLPTKVPTGDPTASPTAEITAPATCEEPERGCGWGIWNIWTCQCDCAPGFCLSSNQMCYDGCSTHVDFNPFGGCIPGFDCPWYPDPTGGAFCVSTVNIAGQYNIHRNAEKCCARHFAQRPSGACVADSEQSVADAQDNQDDIDARPMKYYPDLYGRDNCVFFNGYYDWMDGAHASSYLFDAGEDCCSTWYPARTDCPDPSPPTVRDVDETPYPVTGYFYPHYNADNVGNSCRFGRNYPQWMAQTGFLAEYLFVTPDECCGKWFEGQSNCPEGPDDGVQDGRYWTTDPFFYPNWDGFACLFGNAYPEWMAAPEERDTHLFQSGQACCETWFSDDVQGCLEDTVTYDGTPPHNTPDEWYPTMTYPYDCSSDMDNVPSWMMLPGYDAYYIFPSKAECCKAFYCTSGSNLFY